MNDLSREEFERAIDSLSARVDRGFTGTHQRLDMINGRVGQAEVKVAVVHDRLERLEVDSGESADSGSFFSRRDTALIFAVAALIKGLDWALNLAGVLQ